ncbi:protein slowmo [Neocloeon triangulifer]|uniref:protein slowmo n=1 Tax=Neocloeon triangulifer TaxID=2078957 RepID=UPI00286FA213|nr:protein slowmo [Neocloeon triangulifer]
MRIWTSEHIFDHPWETVTQAAWRKYPNPMNPAVIGTDVIDREVKDGVLHTHRLVSSKWYFPGWARKIIGSANVCYASEWSQVDPNNRMMTLKTRNLTFGSFISWDEQMSYNPHPTDPHKTLLRQEAVISVQGVPLTSYIEEMLTSRVSANAGKGRLAMEWVISRLDAEVKEITHEVKEFTTHARKSTDDFIKTAKKSFDNLSVKQEEQHQ